ncbi:MAG: NAD(P)-dependent oxidoreductase, partial [Pseudomonadota bacterium]
MNKQQALKSLTIRLSQIRPEQVMGRVSGVDGGIVRARGLETAARLGDRAQITNRDGVKVPCEVVRLSETGIVLLPDATLEGVSLGDPVTLSRGGQIAPSDAWIGRLIDPDGNPLDGRSLPGGPVARSLRAKPPAPADRRALGERLATGHLAFDTVLPIVRGQRIGLFAGSGVGKSSLMGRLSQRMEADVVVIALIVGMGRIGQAVAQRCHGGFGMDVVFYNRS